MNKQWEKLLGYFSNLPVICYIGICTVFQFHRWWRDLPDYHQWQVVAGAVFLLFFFLQQYVVLFLYMYRHYHEEDRLKRLGTIVLNVVLMSIVFYITLFL